MEAKFADLADSYKSSAASSERIVSLARDRLFVDVSLYVPANRLLIALHCGSIVGRAKFLRHMSSPLDPSPARRLLRLAPRVGLVVVKLVIGQEIGQVAQVERVRKGRLADLLESRHDQSMAAHRPIDLRIALMQEALQNRPDDAEAHNDLAGLYMQRYELDVKEELRAVAGSQLDDAAIDKNTSPVLLRYRVSELQQAGDDELLSQLRNTDVVRDNLHPAVEHLTIARQCCPLLPLVHYRLAEQSFLMDPPETDTDGLARAQTLRRGDPELLHDRGALHVCADRIAAAWQCWREYLVVCTVHEDTILRRVREELRPREIVDKLLPSSPDYLIRFAKKYSETDDPDLVKAVLSRAESLVAQQGCTDAERHHWLGSICQLRNQSDAAISHFDNAVRLDPRQLDWRFQLAVLLKHQERLNEARQQVRRCELRAQDDSQVARCQKLWEEIGQLEVRQTEGLSAK